MSLRYRFLSVLLTTALGATTGCVFDAPTAEPNEIVLNRQTERARDQLDVWFERTMPLLMSEREVSYMFHDMSTRRLRIGLDRGANRTVVRSLLRAQGVPDSAVTLETSNRWDYVGASASSLVFDSAPHVSALTLQSQVRPVVGGVVIGGYLPGSSTGARCTLGFSVLSTRDALPSFVTNSHCTGALASQQNAQFYQPQSPRLPSLEIGTEVEDPTFCTANTCSACPTSPPPWNHCRYSDAARVAFTTGTPWTLGAIARTALSGGSQLPGPIDITGTLSIVGKSATHSGDSAVCKLGSTSGWTCGTVTAFNAAFKTSRGTLLGQFVVSALSGPGDSGSPVFSVVNGTNSVLLRGLLWGGALANPVPPTYEFYFSPINNIELELGPLTVF